MPPSEDPALLPDEVRWPTRLARWLDWWCTPRWRALVTWVGLAAVVGLVVYWSRLGTRVFYFGKWMWPRLGHLMGFRLPWSVETFVEFANTFVLMVWMEPFALRLNLPRGIAWLALRVGSVGAASFIPSNAGALGLALGLVPLATLPALALCGWRSRPWMVPVGIAAGFGLMALVSYMGLIPNGPHMWAVIEFTLAIALIYGTRLLSPDERKTTVDAVRTWLVSLAR